MVRMAVYIVRIFLLLRDVSIGQYGPSLPRVKHNPERILFSNTTILKQALPLFGNRVCEYAKSCYFPAATALLVLMSTCLFNQSQGSLDLII